MVRTGYALGALAVVAMISAMNKPAAAEVLDAVYRGTMVCDKLPFTSRQMREAIEVTIAGGDGALQSRGTSCRQAGGRYRSKAPAPSAARTSRLQGAWKDSGRAV